ncbi:hypothetical protein HU200_052328 [Digitaria exilis]|uniref:Uncharacterized protein n=1 Tax=Digitaria exilis TaxID=1010633 RepID=A0A835ALB8_9POAL|nr:hypothetical protein HU200_052328 [Digitaria exilis]
MAVVPPEEHRHHQANDDDDDFTFPTPPPLLAGGGKGVHRRAPPCSASASSSPPVWLLSSSSSSSPIRRSFSAADCAASPWRARARLNGACSPALSDYTAGVVFCDDEEEEEEERMDSLWEDLNDDDPRNDDDLFKLGPLDVSRRRSVAGMGAAERARRVKDSREPLAAMLAASGSSRRRPPGLVVMMRALKKMFVAHKGKSRVHRADEQSTASALLPLASNINWTHKIKRTVVPKLRYIARCHRIEIDRLRDVDLAVFSTTVAFPDCSFCTIAGDDDDDSAAFFHRIPGLPDNVTCCLGAAADGCLVLDCTDDLFRRTPCSDKFLPDGGFLQPRHDLRHNHTYLLHNPFSGETTPLPELDDIFGDVEETLEIRKVLMRSSATTDDVVASYYNVVLCRPGRHGCCVCATRFPSL